MSSAQTAYDEANAKLSDAKGKYTTAKTAYEQAQQTEGDKKAEYDRLVEERQQKQDAYDAASADVTAAENARDTANAEVEKLNQQIADLKSNMTVDQNVISQGILGFMNYISTGSQFTATQKKNAQDAVSTLTGVDGKAEWYDEYVDQDMSRDTNPLSLEQMRNALTYLDTQNNLRKANGQSALSVSLRMTVAAALNASYSSNNDLEHSNCYWDNGENLADGGGAYTGGETEDTLCWPYTRLYTWEKKIFDKYVEQYGDELGSHRYDSYYIYQNYNSIYHECGHYLNIVDSATVAIGIATGSGKNADSEVTAFDYSEDDTQADFTVSEFKKLLNDYIDSAYNAGGTQEQKEQLKQLQEKLAEAERASAAADTSYQATTSKQTAAQDALTAADTSVTTAKGEYKQAQSATAAAKTAYDTADANLKRIDITTPKANLDAAKSEAAAAQSALDAANAKVSECQKKAQGTAARKTEAQTALDAAKAKSDKANKAYGDATASVKDLTAKRDAAKADLASKQGAFDDAKKADDAAQAEVERAQAVQTAAATALANAQQEVSSKQQALSDAQGKVATAQTALNAANEAFQRYAAAQKAVDDAKAAYDAAVAGVGEAQKQLDAANEAVLDANLEIVKAKAELAATEELKADLENVDHKASLAAGTTVFNAGWTPKNQLPKLDAAYARYKAAVDAESALKQAAADADAKLSDANGVYAAALAEFGDAKDALAAAQAEYDKYHPKAEPQTKPQVTQTAAKAPAGKQKATSDKLAQTGDNSALAGEVFVIGGITLVAAGVTLSDRRRRQM